MARTESYSDLPVPDQNKSVLVMALVFNTITRRMFQGLESGQEPDLGAAIRVALADLALTDQELLRLWALSALVTQVLKKEYEEHVDFGG
jgi:hypothetical protein